MERGLKLLFPKSHVDCIHKPSGQIFFDDLQLQIIECISPKASVENSSAQWAILYTPQSADFFYFGWSPLTNYWKHFLGHRKITSNHLLQSENGENWCTLSFQDITSTCKIYENRRILSCIWILKNATGKLGIWFNHDFISLKQTILIWAW